MKYKENEITAQTLKLNTLNGDMISSIKKQINKNKKNNFLFIILLFYFLY